MDLDVIRTIQIVDACAISEYQKVLAWVCLAALAAIVVGVALCWAVKKFNRVRRRNKMHALIAVVGISVSVAYGGIGSPLCTIGTGGGCSRQRAAHLHGHGAALLAGGCLVAAGAGGGQHTKHGKKQDGLLHHNVSYLSR